MGSKRAGYSHKKNSGKNTFLDVPCQLCAIHACFQFENKRLICPHHHLGNLMNILLLSTKTYSVIARVPLAMPRTSKEKHGDLVSTERSIIK